MIFEWKIYRTIVNLPVQKMIMGTNKTVIFFFLVFTVFACNNKFPDQKNKTVFRYNESKGITSLDPAFTKPQNNIWPVAQLFNGLVQMDRCLNVKPCIAKSWKISNQAKTYTFFLRNDVYFHDHPVFKGGKGRKVVASDFVYSFHRITDPKIASPGAWVFNNLDKNVDNDFAGCKAINDTVLELYLKHPMPAFTGLLTMTYCSVVPHEIVGYYGEDFRSHPVGTGPFMFKLWKEDEKLVFVKNPHYFEKDSLGNTLPYLDAVDISFIKDKQSEFLEFVKGNIDFMSTIHASYKDELLTRSGKLNPKYSKRFYLLTQPYLNTEYLGFLCDTSLDVYKNSALRIKDVRKAFNYAFDRQKMVAYLRNNIGKPATSGFVPIGLPSFTDTLKGYTYQPDKARALLRKAGFPDGKGLPEITLYTGSDYLDIAEFIQNQVAEVGFSIKIDVVTKAKYLEMIASSRINFFRASWLGDYPDAENYLALFYSKNFCPKGPNYTHFSNATYDHLYEKSQNEPNDSIRYTYYRLMDQMIIDEAVVVPLFYDVVVRFVQKNISGFESNAMNLLMLKTVQKKN
jgi:oligopeptide transport system substrate-binding protein